METEVHHFETHFSDFEVEQTFNFLLDKWMQSQRNGQNSSDFYACFLSSFHPLLLFPGHRQKCIVSVRKKR